jgi:hypothetical protein
VTQQFGKLPERISHLQSRIEGTLGFRAKIGRSIYQSNWLRLSQILTVASHQIQPVLLHVTQGAGGRDAKCMHKVLEEDAQNAQGVGGRDAKCVHKHSATWASRLKHLKLLPLLLELLLLPWLLCPPLSQIRALPLSIPVLLILTSTSSTSS